MKLYIAGPMTGIPRYNFPAFDKMRDALQDAGYTCISPADMDRDIGFDGNSLIPKDQHKEFCRDAVVRNVYALAKCEVDGIILLPNFENSKGTRVEIAVAQLLGLKIFKPCMHGYATAMYHNVPDREGRLDYFSVNFIAIPVIA